MKCSNGVTEKVFKSYSFDHCCLSVVQQVNVIYAATDLQVYWPTACVIKGCICYFTNIFMKMFIIDYVWQKSVSRRCKR